MTIITGKYELLVDKILASNLLDPYDVKFLNAHTNLAEFMTSGDTVYGGIVGFTYPFEQSAIPKSLEVNFDNLLNTEILLNVFEEDINGDRLIFQDSQPKSNFNISADNEELLSYIKGRKNIGKELTPDIEMQIALSLMGMDYQDPLSFYQTRNLSLFRVEKKWYLSSIDTNNFQITLFKFIPLSDMVKTLATTDEDVDDSVLLPLICKTVNPTPVSKSTFTKETNIYSLYNPVVAVGYLLKDFDMLDGFETNTGLQEDLPVLNKLEESVKEHYNKGSLHKYYK